MVGAVKSKQKSSEDRGKCRDSTHLPRPARDRPFFYARESLGLMSHAQSIFDRCAVDALISFWRHFSQMFNMADTVKSSRESNNSSEIAVNFQCNRPDSDVTELESHV